MGSEDEDHDRVEWAVTCRDLLQQLRSFERCPECGSEIGRIGRDLSDRFRQLDSLIDDARLASARDLERRRAATSERDAMAARLAQLEERVAAYLSTHDPEVP